MTHSAASLRRGIVFVLASMFVAAPALGWDIAVGTQSLANGLFVQSWSGPGFQETTIDERIRAWDQPGTTVPFNWTTQSWDAQLGEWPQADLLVSDGVTFANLFNDETTTERWTSAEAVVFGPVTPGRAVGAGVAYDYEFVVLPFTTGTLVLDPGETYANLISEPGDVGQAFTSIKLYRPDLDLNAPGGANFPLAQSSQTLLAGGAPIETNPEFSWSFQNATGSAQTYHLRFELGAAVFAVPEPGVAAGLAAGVLGLAQLGRRVRSERRVRLG